MKRFVVAGLATLALVGMVSTADAQRRGRVIVEQSGGIDANTLLLLGATGALGTGAGGLSSILPLLALQQPSTTVIERAPRRWRGPRPAPTSR